MLMLLVVAVYSVVWLKDVIVISSVMSLMTAVLILKILDVFRKVGNNRLICILFLNYIQCRHISGLIIFCHYVINTRTRYENEGRMYMIILKKNNFSNIFYISQETHQHFHLLLSLSVCQQLSHNLQVTWIHVNCKPCCMNYTANRLVILTNQLYSYLNFMSNIHYYKHKYLEHTLWFTSW